MQEDYQTPLNRLIVLIVGLLKMPPGAKRISVAFAYGFICHSVFALAVCAMIFAMFFGMSESFGRVPKPWSYFTNGLLILQFPIMHSLLLSRWGRPLLNRFAPAQYAPTLSTTTYAIIASFQLLLLFLLWTPSGIVWWRAEGVAFYSMCALYIASWMLLMKASYDAGAEVQSGALGWISLAQNKQPIFPGMPITGLFRVIRQPIYVAFALTLWTVPTWTPDQLALAATLTAYCLVAPVLKERRFIKLYGSDFQAYQSQVPYAVPYLKRSRKGHHDDWK